jgi:hypothetical protein
MTNLVQDAVARGGKLAPLVIPGELTNGTGLMNASVFVRDSGEILVNVRHVNYTLYHSENGQHFPSRWGPLSYLHPEKYQKLATTNYLCRMNSDLQMTDWTIVDTSKLDVEPLWEFVGLEDARLVEWDGALRLIGVRRDTTTNGEGRMEISTIDLNERPWSAQEVSRVRINTPFSSPTYCEKNWVPVLNTPFHMVKWTCPTELVKFDPTTGACDQVFLREGLTPPKDQRGSSHVFSWKGFYVSITHEVDLYNNYLGQKDGVYRHRFVVWDQQWNQVGLSPLSLSFIEGQIEFCAGAAIYENDLLVSFGFQDNAAFVLRMTEAHVDEIVKECLAYGA